MTGDSRTDLEALRRSGSGKILALALVLLAALGAAAWFLFFKPQGIGAAEEADKVLIVRSGDIAGYSAVLSRGGFDAAEGRLEHWVDKARDELPEMPEGTDVQVVLTLADHFGYGFVVFEHPADVDFTGVEFDAEPDFAEHVRFAAVSIGDFAFPHVVTVNPEPSKALRRLDISILQALFAQAPLQEALPGNASASVEAIQIRSKLEDAILDLQLVDMADALADQVSGDAARVLADERGESKPVRLSSALESGNAMPVPGGGVFVSSRAYDVVTDDGLEADLAPAPTEDLWFASKPGVDGRTRCSSIETGQFGATEAPRFTYADDGRALVIDTRSDGPRLWVSNGQGECGYTLKGSVPETRLSEAPIVLPHGSGKVVRVGTIDGEATVEVLEPGAAQPRVALIELTGVAVRDVAWLDADHLVATGDDGLLYLVAAADGGRILSVAPPELGVDPTLYEVARAGERAVVVTVGSSPRRLVHIDMGQTWSALFASPPALPLPEPQVEASDADLPPPLAVRLDPTGLRSTVLTRAGRAREPVVSADGTRVVFSLLDRALDDPGQADDAEIAMVATGGGALQLLTRNALRDRTPRFTSDGAWVLFETRLELPKSSWRITVPRAVQLSQ